jgi:hypothetical protein
MVKGPYTKPMITGPGHPIKPCYVMVRHRRLIHGLASDGSNFHIPPAVPAMNFLGERVY